uniref:UDP-galactose transporter n=1 Tax=Panagrolaimus sp. ES5 TaxID=591445 RepID=A0AC34FH72_9BILA
MLKFVLQKKLSNTQWIALVLLIVGVSDVQLQYQPPQPVSGYLEQKPLLGFAAAITMCFTSAFAGVYMENILKKSSVNVWMQNIRLALFGLIVAAASMLYKDYSTIKEDGLLRGFDSLVWIMTVTNSIGGLLIAVVIKYADNIMKAYAQSTAIIGAAIGSWLLFDFTPNGLFLFGTFLVMASIIIYTKHPYQENISDKNYVLLNEEKINKV